MDLPSPASRVRRLAPAALVMTGALAALIAYLQALYYPFILDDIGYISWNTRLTGLPAAELWRLLGEPYNDYAEFLPLRDLSYWLDITLFGQVPAAFRLHNIILYLLCLPLVFGCTLRVWRYFRPADAASAPWVAAVTTALFALHPAHAEAVVWISGRKDVLAGLFSLLALWLALDARRERGFSPPLAAATLVTLLAAMLAKASAVAVAPVIALLWVIYWRDIPAQERRRPLLLWPLASILLAICMAALFSSFATEKIPLYFGVEAVTRSLAVLGWLARLAVSPESRHFYHPVFEDANLHVMVALGIAVLAVAIAGVVVILRKRSMEGYAVVAFLLICLPSLQLIPYAPPSLVSDRFVFLAVWPVLLLLVALAWRLNTVPRTVLLMVIAMSWAFQTSERPRDWRNFETLVNADLRSYPGYYMPAVYKITSFQLPRRLYRDAEQTADPITTPAFRSLMLAMIAIHHGLDADAATTGKLQQAMVLLWKLGGELKHPPVEAQWNSPLNNLWIKMPFLLAIEWKHLAERFPDDVSVSYNAGSWMLDAQRYSDAVSYLRIATESPQLPSHLRGMAYTSLGTALLGSGNVAAAEVPLHAALKQSPPDLRAYCRLAEIYKQTGRLAEAASAEATCPDR